MIIPNEHPTGVRSALDRAADRAMDQASHRPEKVLVGILLAAVALRGLGWALSR